MAQASTTDHAHDDHGYGLSQVATIKTLLATGMTLLFLTVVTVVSSKIDFGGASINLAITMVENELQLAGALQW